MTDPRRTRTTVVLACAALLLGAASGASASNHGKSKSKPAHKVRKHAVLKHPLPVGWNKVPNRPS